MSTSTLSEQQIHARLVRGDEIVVRPDIPIHFLSERYGTHYNVVWIRTSDAWHHSEAELPDEFTIVATLMNNVSMVFAEMIADMANQECDLIGRRGRWAIVIPAGLIQ